MISTLLEHSRVQAGENPHVLSTAVLRTALEKGFSTAC
jgi:hypothetical protein